MKLRVQRHKFRVQGAYFRVKVLVWVKRLKVLRFWVYLSLPGTSLLTLKAQLLHKTHN